MKLVTLDDVLAARELLDGVARMTPLEPNRALSELVGGPVLLKCENLQRAGSFKIRGAYTRMARLSAADRSRGVVAASAGNHAQGVALAGQLLGIPVTVFMPAGAPLPKLAATRNYGATVEIAGQTVDDALVAASSFASEHGAVLIHPFDHPDIVAGQGTVAIEIVEQCPEVGTVVVSTGGGGLLAGVAVALRAIKPETRLVGVQAAGAAAWPRSLAAGGPRRLDSMRTIADGIAVGQPGELPFTHVQELVDEVVTVTEEELSRALLFGLERAKLVVEPAGAAGLAAVLASPAKFEPPVVVVLSGGNIDPLLLVRVIEYGLAAGGRYPHFTVRFADRPGMLAGVLAHLASTGANVLDVEHQRHDPTLPLGEVAVSLSIETRGHEHSAAVLDGLRAAGYHVTPR